MRKKVLLTQRLHKVGMELLEKETHVSILKDDTLGTLKKQIVDTNAIIIRVGQLPADIIEIANNLEVIGRPGIGFDSIDYEAATMRGIPIVYVPGINRYSVAEHALALMLALSKNLKLYDQELRNNNWESRNQFCSMELRDKKIGIIGFGKIGMVLASYCKALNMEVTIYKLQFRNDNLEIIEKEGYAYTDKLKQLLTENDLISINCPLTKDTKNLIGKEELALMKNSALLINTARGEIVNEAALIKALRQGKIRGAGIDVFEKEPLPKDHPFYDLDNVILTPHSAALTAESIIEAHISVVKGVLALLRGENWHNIANPMYKDWR